jgi:hypothetical protein
LRRRAGSSARRPEAALGGRSTLRRPLARPPDWIWRAAVAVALASALALWVLPGLPSVRWTLMGLVAAGLIVAVSAAGLKMVLREKYDLSALAAVHDRAELDTVREPSISDDADEVICLGCGEAFHPRLPACPRCGRIHGN